ncbi:MAG: transglutaminase TgpA family protein [Gammaproteobacteria bacterium]
MSTEFEKKILFFLLLSIGLIALPHAYHIATPLFAFFNLLLVWRFLGIWQPRILPGKFTIFIVTLVGLFLLYSQHQGILGRTPGTSLFITALGLKLLEIKEERDLYLIVYLAFIVAASQFLFEQNVLMAVYTLFVCSVLLATLVSINGLKIGNAPAMKTSAVIIAQALPIAVALFVLFPRVEAPRWMLFKDKSQARTGLKDSMEPGSISELGFSDELVFRVKFDGSIPPNNQRYWRGPVLTHTDGKRWIQTKGMFYQRYQDKVEYLGAPYRYTLMMEPQNKNWVFALDIPERFSKELSINANYQLVTDKDPDKRAEYRVVSYPSYNTGYITRTEYKESLQLPGPPSQRIVDLVRQLQGFELPPDLFIGAVMRHFRQENFRYTLMPPLMKENPIETFLFDARAGFCGHYASAFVYLMRVAGIPARVVTGYQGGEINKIGEFLEVRQANAHAWAEVWLENKGWARIDPTSAIAPERVEKNIDIAEQIASGNITFVDIDAESAKSLDWLKEARQLWGSMDYSWNRWVINYNPTNQSSFLASLGIETVRQMVYWLIGIMALIAACLSWMLLRNRPRTSDKLIAHYQRFCAKAAKAGPRRKPGEGAIDYAKRLKHRLPEHSAAIDDITALFVKLRYGRRSNPDDLNKFKRKVDNFRIKPVRHKI